MAELSEKDKRTLFGENYKEVLEKAEQEGLVASVQQRNWTADVEKSESKKFSAAAVMIVGGLIALSNYFAWSGPSVMLVGIAGVAIFLAGAAWYWRLWHRLRELKANPIAEGGPPPSTLSAPASHAGEDRSEHAAANNLPDHPPLEAASAR